ncbi:sulfotransferase domain-containing protein [Caldovatus aquaticus]|uniref:Sulfotransferase n=1 Tax=Caldovatus aquaticus TaxID=2865671 RepID=A0ABS7F3F2_9PROT|nr:sulfotransferase domain-containing protein [Caldovatus aquaticus]MBW8270019.1 sulfotransferase [Caldovatus aquaticus]
MAPRLTLCAGQYGSGSTWVFNAVRGLLAQATGRGEIPGFYADSLRDLPEFTRVGAPLVVKAHRPDRSLRLLGALYGAPMVVSVRDPRDAVVSMAQRFGEPVPDCARAVAESARHLVLLLAQPRVLVLRYEDRFTAADGTVARLAAFLGLAVSEASCAQIAAGLTPERVRATVAALEQAGVYGAGPDPRRHDPATLWHARHVGDGRVGKHREALAPEAAAEVLAATAEYCRAFGYGGEEAAAAGSAAGGSGVPG